jgi:excisionase family DNA binding protein
MDNHSMAVENSLRREENTPDSLTHPVSESRPFGVVAGRQGSADALQELVKVCERIADGIENQNRAVIQAVPPEALSMKDAAQFLGVGVPTIRELVRTRKLPYIQYGSQRGRMFLVEDLRNFLKENRRSSGEVMVSKRRRA